MIIMDPDDVSGFICFQNAIRKHVVEPLIVLPPLSFRPAIGWAMLFIVKKGIYLSFGVTAPAALVLQLHLLVRRVKLIAQPDG